MVLKWGLCLSWGGGIINESNNTSGFGAVTGDSLGSGCEIDDFSLAGSDSDINTEEGMQVATFERNGVKIVMRGINANYFGDTLEFVLMRNNILSVDSSVDVLSATVSIPRCDLRPIMLKPKLYVRGDGERSFSVAQRYCDENSTCFNDVKVTPSSYEFIVEHFTDYYVNSSGGNYSSLEGCLIDINNTDGTCVLTESWTETFNQSRSFFTNGSTIRVELAGAAHNDTFLDFSASTFIGTGDNALFTAIGMDPNNLTVKNANIVNMTYSFWIGSDTYPYDTKGQLVRLENINMTNMFTGSAVLVFEALANLSVNNIRLDGSFVSGLLFDRIIDSNLSNITIMGTNGSYGMKILYDFDCANIKMENLNISNTYSTYAFDFDTGGGCINSELINSFFENNEGEEVVKYDAKLGYINNNTFRNNKGVAFTTEYQNNTISNNTFENNGQKPDSTHYFTSLSPINVSGILMNETDLLVSSSDLSVMVFVAQDDTDASSVLDGTKNLSRWGINAPDASFINGTAYVEMGYTSDCPTLAATYNGTCYSVQDDYWVANGNANYTINSGAENSSVNIINGYTTPPYIRYHLRKNKVPDILIDDNGLSNRITQNTFINNVSYTNADNASIMDLYSTSNEIWLNNFYYIGNVTPVGANNTFCNSNEGNFYVEGFSSIPSSECGLVNVTNPQGGEVYNKNQENISINWTKQSSDNNINYRLYYSDDGSSWNFLDTTSALSYEWDISSVSGGNYSIKVVPDDGTYSGVGDISEGFTIVPPDNEWVCSNETICEYQDITSALNGENGTIIGVRLKESDIINTINSNGTYYNLTIWLYGNDTVLDCNGAKLKQPIAGTRGVVLYYNTINNTIKNCNVTGYAEGIGIFPYSKNNTIMNNFISLSMVGMDIYSFSSGTLILNNTFDSNMDGVYVFSDNNSVINNTFNGWTTMDGASIYITFSSYNTLINNKFEGSRYGLYLYGSNYTLIKSNNVTDNGGEGLLLYLSSNNTVVDNFIENNSDEGIFSLSSSGNYIINNSIISNLANGMYIWDSNGTILVGNNVTGNNRTGIFIVDSSNNNVINNTVSDNNDDGLTLADSTNLIITGNNLTFNYPDGIYVTDSSNISLYNNMVQLNSAGIYMSYVNYTYINSNDVSYNNFSGLSFDYVNNSNITNNILEFNDYGLTFFFSDNNYILGNLINSSFIAGIYFDGALNNSLINNKIMDSLSWGANLQGSKYNIILNNTFNGSGYDGLRLDPSSNENLVINNTFGVNEIGLYLYAASNNNITTNLFKEDLVGVYVDNSDSNIIYDNNFIYNGIGSIFESSNKNIIEGNLIQNNSDGIYFDFSDNNTFNNNSMIFQEGISISLSSAGNNLTNNTLIVSTYGGIEIYKDYNLIKHNYFNVSTIGYYDLKLFDAASNNKIFLNNFSGNGVNDLGTNNVFCLNGEGNFYGQNASQPDTECELDVYNLSVVEDNGSFRIFKFKVKNIDSNSNDIIYSSLDTGESVINDSSSVNLLADKEMFVFVDYNYTGSGNFNIIAQANTTLTSENDEINITV